MVLFWGGVNTRLANDYLSGGEIMPAYLDWPLRLSILHEWGESQKPKTLARNLHNLADRLLWGTEPLKLGTLVRVSTAYSAQRSMND